MKTRFFKSLFLILFIFLASCNNDKEIVYDNNFLLEIDFSSEDKFKKSYTEYLKKIGLTKNINKVKNFIFKYDENLDISKNKYEIFIENNPQYILQVITDIQKKKIFNKEQKNSLIFTCMQAFSRHINVAAR
tara:strand:- start:327 stop:722 length:396 start_codon:yes stop_codon:yes gene_type:complete